MRHSLTRRTFSDQSDFFAVVFGETQRKTGGEAVAGLAGLGCFLRSTSLSTLRLVQIRVEIRVVVHLELVVGLMTLAAPENIVEQFL